MTPTFPYSLRIGPFTYKVGCDPSSQAVLEEAEAVGLTIPDALEIHLSEELSPDRARATLLHEVVHALADLADLGDDGTEEEWASRLGPLLLQVLRDNPHMLAWVLEE